VNSEAPCNVAHIGVPWHDSQRSVAGSVAGRLDFNDVKSTDMAMTMVTMAIIQYHPHLRRTCHLYDETQEVKALLLFFVT
jgi:hypothetical protein